MNYVSVYRSIFRGNFGMFSESKSVIEHSIFGEESQSYYTT